jgi:RNA polymerase sigma factor (sigma-70 family)
MITRCNLSYHSEQKGGLEIHPLRSQDQELVRRCLAEDAEAWAILFRTYHRLMVSRLVRTLHGYGFAAGAAADLAQEVAAEVWLKLMANDRRRLRSFDPRRGRFGTYLVAVARRQLIHVGMRLRQQSAREKPVLDHVDLRCQAGELSFDTWIEEFLPRLSRRERVYFQQELLGRLDTGQVASFTTGSAWKLKSRVFRKLAAFLDGR